jgi:hypothetical protein
MAAVMKMFKTVYQDRVKRNKETHSKQAENHKKEMEKVDLKKDWKNQKRLKRGFIENLESKKKEIIKIVLMNKIIFPLLNTIFFFFFFYLRFKNLIKILFIYFYLF